MNSTCGHSRIYSDSDSVYRCSNCHTKVDREEWEYAHSRAWDD